jgi:chemotaxis protein MotA
VDIATIIGFIAGFGCVIVSVISGSSPLVFVHIPSMMIVVGGMLSATLIHFPLKNFLSIAKVTRKTLLFSMPAPGQIIQDVVNYTAVNRRDGALALEQHISKLKDPFMIRALQMVVDGTDQRDIRAQMDLEIAYLQERHDSGKKILDFMGASAPAFGMIGTLIGLVQMLGSLESPDQIGAGMAVALLTTFYGAILANLVFIPLSGKLALRSKGETLMREMILEGILGLVRGDSPTSVRDKMSAFLNTHKRSEFKPQL